MNFKHSYHTFATELQNLELLTKKVSQESLQNLKLEIERRFRVKYQEELDKYRELSRSWSLAEGIYLGLISGFLGSFIDTITAFILGMVPPVLYAARLTPAFADFVIYRLSEKETAFYQFIEELRSLIHDTSEHQLSNSQGAE